MYLAIRNVESNRVPELPPQLNPHTLFDPKPLDRRQKRIVKLLLTTPLGKTVPYRTFFDNDISLASLATDMCILRRVLKVHGLGIRSDRERGYHLYVIESSS
jgi:hypothetical protein